MGIRDIYGQLSRCRTASGSNTGLFRVGSTKVKARTSFLYTEGAHKVYIRNPALVALLLHLDLLFVAIITMDLKKPLQANQIDVNSVTLTAHVRLHFF